MRRSVILALTSLALVVALPAAAVELPTERVLKMDGNQWRPSANTTHLAFQSNSRARPNRWNVWAMDLVTEELEKVNAPGTNGYAGNLVPETNSVIYQQVDGNSSDIYTYDIDTDTRTPVAEVNTGKWEWAPRMSETFLVFVRNERHAGHMKYVLRARELMTGTEQVLGRWRIDQAYSVEPGEVGDTYATWTVCYRTCEVFVRDLLERETARVPAPRDRPQYGVALDESVNELYYIRSGFGCGLNVGIWTVPIDDPGATPEKLASLPSGVDADTLATWHNPVSSQDDLLFARVPCRATFGEDIWAVRGVS